MTKPRALWVFAHPATDSLNRSLATDGITTLSATHDVTLVDLYADGWDPVLRDAGHENGGTLGERLRNRQLEGNQPADVAAQQALLRDVDLLVVQFPLWWYSLPAILKGWIDRVFANGFAFGIKDEHGTTLKYGDGNLQGKRALAIVTAGDRPTAFNATGINGHIEWLLFPLLHGTFWYTGMSPLHPHLIAGADRPGWDNFTEQRSRLADRLAHISTEEPIRYRPLSSGDYDANRTLIPNAGAPSLDIHRTPTP